MVCGTSQDPAFLPFLEINLLDAWMGFAARPRLGAGEKVQRFCR